MRYLIVGLAVVVASCGARLSAPKPVLMPHAEAETIDVPEETADTSLVCVQWFTEPPGTLAWERRCVLVSELRRVLFPQ